jgi:hypothetical protein
MAVAHGQRQDDVDGRKADRFELRLKREWSITCWLPSPWHQAHVSGLDAVAMTVSDVSRRASWMAIELTPPAPPTTRIFAARYWLRG